MLAVVMAGGKGTRLRPLTCGRPKPMVPVANRPLLEHVLRHLAANGWSEIALTVCYLPDKIEAYFGPGQSLGMNIRYFREEQPLGTAGSVKMAEDLCTETILVASGDALSDLDLRAALAFHRERQALATLVLKRVDAPLEYGIVVTEEDGKIKRFLEKPGWGEVFSDTVNTGFYLLEPEVLRRVPAGQAFDFSRNLFPALLQEGAPLFGYVADGYWSDIGTLDQYRRAHVDLLSGRVKLDLAGREWAPGIRVGFGTEIDPEAVVEGPCLLGDYCRIERGSVLGAYTVIGDYGHLGRGSSLKRSVLWRHVYVGPEGEIRGAVLGDHAVVRNNASLYEGVVVGDGCLVGAHCQLRPEVRLWPEKNVESGQVVHDSMIWGERSWRGLFGGVGVAGIANTELTPEYAARLGGAFAATIGPGCRLAIASDASPSADLLKGALIAGILGAGLAVRDIGAATAPAIRHVIGLMGFAGGAHLGLRAEDGEVVIQFLDAGGLPLSRQDERSLEQSFQNGDFPRVAPDRVGESALLPEAAQSYLEAIVAEVAAEQIRSARFEVLLEPLQGPPSSFLPILMDRFGCRILTGAAERGQSRPAHWLGGPLTVGTDRSGESLHLSGADGIQISQAQLTALTYLAELRRGKRASLPAPVQESRALSDLAAQFGAPLVRTKAQRRAIMAEFAAETPAMRGLLLPAFDALFSLALILELLALEGLDLGRLLASLPSYPRVERAVACSWAAKGRLMRRLFEQSRGREVDLTDGLRIHDERGWALILPDGEDPLVRVFSEAGSRVEAENLGRIWAEKIKAAQIGE